MNRMEAESGVEPSIDKVAWLFPGQGAQQVGMGRALCEKSAAARDLFAKADAVLGRRLSEICFDGPDDILRQTINTQPAIMTVSLACLATARERGEPLRAPACVAGHSLGEYTAAVAVDALSFEDGLLLVQERGRLMQAAGEENPGTMIAVIGLSEAAARELCAASGAHVCNVNGPEQVVVGGSVEAVAKASELARSFGARKTVPLNVSGAFHTSLMQPAAIGMATALGNTLFRDPEAPIIANGTAEVISDGALLREELSYQLTHAVLWRQSVERMLSMGISIFVEFGPGQVLSGLVKRMAPSATLRAMGEAELLAEAPAAASGTG
jgi:[acyl-carrier-protein] S-malonyltransferase